MHQILNFVQEKVKNCTLISHFASAFAPAPHPGLPSPDLLTQPPFQKLLIHLL